MMPDEWFSCKRKIKYGRLATAERAVEQMKRKAVHKLEAYKCRYCDGYHIGRVRTGMIIQFRLWS